MRYATNQQAVRHPKTLDDAEAGGYFRCYSGDVPAFATRGRSGYWTVHLLKDPGAGSLLQTGVAPTNIEWVDMPPEFDAANQSA